MYRILAIMLVIVLVVACTSTKPYVVKTPEVVDYDGLMAKLSLDTDTTYVLHFWATWCGPCLEELPMWEKFYKKDRKEKTKLVLVSLDFDRQITSKLVPFMKREKIDPEVVVLSDRKMTRWINAVNPNWDGNIPATFLLKKHKRRFHGAAFETYEELKQFIYRDEN